MASYTNIFNESAGLLADGIGELVVYNVGGPAGGARRVMAYPIEDELAPRENEQTRNPLRTLVLRVPRASVPDVQLKVDTVSNIPAQWMGRTGDRLTLQVHRHAEGRTRPGFHTLECVVASGGAS